MVLLPCYFLLHYRHNMVTFSLYTDLLQKLRTTGAGGREIFQHQFLAVVQWGTSFYPVALVEDDQSHPVCTFDICVVLTTRLVMATHASLSNVTASMA